MRKANSNRQRDWIEKVIRQASGADACPEEIYDMVSRWLLENEDNPDHEKVMSDLFETDSRFGKKPSRECLEDLPLLKERLGMAATARRLPLYRRTYFKYASVAAAILIFVLAGIGLMSRSGVGSAANDSPVIAQGDNPARVQVEIEACPGVQKDVMLSDNSHVWVNSDSRITYPEEFGRERHVNLQGHARFDVARDTVRPFHVHTEHLQVTVLGTDFQVREYPDEQYTEVLLYEGAVEVSAGERMAALVPGQRLVFNHRSGELNVETVRLDTIADWRTDEITAMNLPITSILRMIGNYYDKDMVFSDGLFGSDGEVFEITFGKRNTPAEILDILAKVSGGMFEYEERENDILIYKPN